MGAIKLVTGDTDANRRRQAMKPIILYLFSEKVNSLDEPPVREFREILDRISLSYNCRLINFSINHGTVTFQFDDPKVMRDILADIIHTVGFQEDYSQGKIGNPQSAQNELAMAKRHSQPRSI